MNKPDLLFHRVCNVVYDMVPFRLKTVGAAEFSPCSPTRQGSQVNKKGVGVLMTFQDVFFFLIT